MLDSESSAIRQPRWVLVFVGICALGGGVLGGLGHAEISGERFRSEQFGISLRSPRGWTLLEDRSYPAVLLSMTRRRPSAQMYLSAEKKTEGLTSQSYSAQVSEELTKLGFEVRAPQLHSATGAYWMDFDNGKRYLRQALLVPNNSEWAYSLTLSTSSSRSRSQLLRPFDLALRSISILKNAESPQ